MIAPHWSEEDRQSFADGDVLKATRRPGRRLEPPTPAEQLADDDLDDDPLPPPASVEIDIVVAGDSALDHVDRLSALEISTALAAVLGVTPARLTVVVTVDSTR
jgi:hypothetical protein